MNKRAYEIKLKNGKNDITVGLRLTASGLMELKKKYKEDPIASVMSSISDIDKMCYIFGLALNYKDNENVVTKGDELYDLLVDNGYAGQEAFAKLITSLAVFSGILSEKRKEQIDAYAAGMLDEAFGTLEEDEKNARSSEQ